MTEYEPFYPGKMFTDLHKDYHPFFDYGVGAVCWGHDSEKRRELYFLAPYVEPDAVRPYICVAIYVMTNGEDWKVPGDVNGWDGNLGKPTLTPSLWLMNRKGWHGFIRAGDLYTA